MRYGPTARRTRNNNNRGGSQGQGQGQGHGNNQGQNQQRRAFQNKNKVFDSNGPDVRIRGTAYQIIEKYQTLAKDSASAGDRVLAESYAQYVEHYQRIINSWEDEYAPDPFDTNYEQAYAMYNQRAAERDIRRAIEAEAVEAAEEEQSMREEDDLGLPSSIVGNVQVVETPRVVELTEA
ncbi:MAG: DUF4167 domain-containing protein [Pseudomonadota bacterium]